jgi:hypothetical protein
MADLRTEQELDIMKGKKNPHKISTGFLLTSEAEERSPTSRVPSSSSPIIVLGCFMGHLLPLSAGCSFVHPPARLILTYC